VRSAFGLEAGRETSPPSPARSNIMSGYGSFNPRGGAIAVGGVVATGTGGVIVGTADTTPAVNTTPGQAGTAGGQQTNGQTRTTAVKTAKDAPDTAPATDGTTTSTGTAGGLLAATGVDTVHVAAFGGVILAIGAALVVFAAIMVRVGWRRQRVVSAR
jgi:hypothetical protein